MGVALVADVEQKTVPAEVEDVVHRDGQFDHSEIRSRWPPEMEIWSQMALRMSAATSGSWATESLRRSAGDLSGRGAS